MHLQPEGDAYKIRFDKDDERPVTEACREMIFRIASNDHFQGERVYTNDDAHVVVALSKIAIHANTRKGELLPLDSEEVRFLDITLDNFSSIEGTKEAIETSVARSGLLSNTQVEARVHLGQRALGVLGDLRAQKEALDAQGAQAA